MQDDSDSDEPEIIKEVINENAIPEPIELEAAKDEQVIEDMKPTPDTAQDSSSSSSSDSEPEVVEDIKVKVTFSQIISSQFCYLQQTKPNYST